ncbi:MAG: DUF456 domain-containing protein [Halanaerobiaceae bacterium]
MVYIIWVFIYLFFILSIAGVILPVIPDTLLLWIGIFLYKFVLSGDALTSTYWLFLVVVTLIILSSDFMTNSIVLKKYGGSRLAILAAVVGLIVGMVFLGPIGVIVGPFILVYLVVFMQTKDSKKSFRLGFVTIIAFFSSAFLKILLQLIMILWFVILIY